MKYQSCSQIGRLGISDQIIWPKPNYIFLHTNDIKMLLSGPFLSTLFWKNTRSHWLIKTWKNYKLNQKLKQNLPKQNQLFKGHFSSS